MSGSRLATAGAQTAAGLCRLVDDFEAQAVLTAEAKHATAAAGMVRRFLWAQRVHLPEHLSSPAIRQHLAALSARGRSRKTLMNYRSAIGRFCDLLCEQGLLPDNPCRHVRLGKLDEPLPRYLEPDEVAEVLRVARQHGAWPEVCLALSTGLRLSELIRLRWSDIDTGRRCLTVRKSKSHRPRVVPLSTAALAALAEQRAKSADLDFVFPARQTWPGGWRYVNRRRAPNWWHRALGPVQDAVPKFRTLPGSSTGRAWHLFRHTFASRAAQNGVSLYKLAQWLGHSDVRTTRIYAHLQAGFDEEIEAAAPLPARRAEPGLPLTDRDDADRIPTKGERHEIHGPRPPGSLRGAPCLGLGHCRRTRSAAPIEGRE